MAFDFVGTCKGLVKPLIFFAWLVFLSASLASCQVEPTVTHPTATLPVTLIPFRSATPEKSPGSQNEANSTPHPAPTSTALPTPTPTPFIYQVKKGDTLLGIALYYGLTLEALQAANPKVNPNFLSVGTQLVIPIAQASKIPTATPSPTPLPLSIDAPRCFSQGKAGAWCVAQLTNDQLYAVDNLLVWFNLADANGTVLTRTQVTPLLDWIPAGETLPLLAFFPDNGLPLDAPGLAARAELTDANPVPAQGGRYLPLRVQVRQVQISPDGMQAVVQGQIDYPLPPPPGAAGGTAQAGATPSPNPQPTLPADQVKANVIWVLAVAYDAQGQAIGARRWEAEKGLKPSASMNFAASVYSLGPPIDHVHVILEARNQ
jgi:LysM repeat protein